MKRSTKVIGATVIAAAITLTGAYALAQQGMAHGQGMMGRHHQNAQGSMMQGMGMGHGMMGMLQGEDTTAAESEELFDMFMNHDRITRSVTNLPDGIRTVTESDNPELSAAIVSHVVGMINRVEENRDPGLVIQSPTLDILFRNRDLIETSFEPTPNGIIVIQTSDDAATVAALQKHAAEVSDMVDRGMAAVHDSMMGRMTSRQ
jgi:hypothetical protein